MRKKATMTRYNFYCQPKVMRKVESLAFRRNVSAAQVIREAVDKYLLALEGKRGG